MAVDRRAVDGVAARQIERAADQDGRAVGHSSAALSGGNQQKVVLGKWLEVAPRVVLLDDPTRGVDVGAKREIYPLVRELADAGRIVLFRSTELPELVGLADRILVFYRGRLSPSAAPATSTTRTCCGPSTPARLSTRPAHLHRHRKEDHT